MQAFTKLDGHFDWGTALRAEILREIALQAAVALDSEGLEYMKKVPVEARDEQLLQWWARLALARGNWAEVKSAIDAMGDDRVLDSRWRYWRARARIALSGAAAGRPALEALSGETRFYGFLAADDLGKPYSICPLRPEVPATAVSQLREQPDIHRALELYAVGLDRWALSEWSLATARLDPSRLKVAAALALEEHHYDRAIFALGDSGELQYYEWRFPLLWKHVVSRDAGARHIDPAWLYGIMRSESAMTVSARSSAGALGLMQITPSTAKRLAREHGLHYRSSDQLMDAEQNIRFGAWYLRDLLDRYDHNPVRVSAAYNAGPRVLDNWLSNRPLNPPARWLETLPYFETRDYIPRVLAFTTLYDWLLGNPVVRVSSRMAGVTSAGASAADTAAVACAHSD